jgi:hypothetical protein
VSLSAVEMKALYDATVVVRRPTYGIISGYHELPYVCLGPSFEASRQTCIVRGKIQVSPRFVVTPPQFGPSYEEIFGDEHTDAALVGRLFGFMGFRERPVECKSAYLQLEHVDAPVDRVLSGVLDDIERREDITCGVLVSPNPQYFPVSIERLIGTVLEDEFRP